MRELRNDPFLLLTKDERSSSQISSRLILIRPWYLHPCGLGEATADKRFLLQPIPLLSGLTEKGPTCRRKLEDIPAIIAHCLMLIANYSTARESGLLPQNAGFIL